MDQNRRRFLRKVPNDIAFIQIERDEVGKVLNISEGGLSFSSVSPVPRNLPVYFWFSFNLKDRIEAMGEVTWTDLSRTVGGLRFTQLSEGGREQIQQWLSRLRREEIPREAGEKTVEERETPGEEVLVPQLVTAGAPAPIRTGEANPQPLPMKTAEKKTGGLDRVAKFVSKARAYRPAATLEGTSAVDLQASPSPALEMASPPDLASEPKLQAEPPKPRLSRAMFSMETGAAQPIETTDSKFSSLSFRGIESLVELVPLQRYLSAKKRQLLCGVILGVCMSAAVTVPAMKFWNSRARADMKPEVTDSSLAKSNAPLQPPSASSPSVPAVNPNYPVAGVFSDPAPIPFKTKKGTASKLIARSESADPYWDKPTRTVSAKTPATPVQTPPNNAAAASKKSGMTANQLWGAVQAGNSKAAVELAELYIKGDGVPRNCQQARVLLLMASERRNTAAIKRLQQLDKGAACP